MSVVVLARESVCERTLHVVSVSACLSAGGILASLPVAELVIPVNKPQVDRDFGWVQHSIFI